MNLQKMWAEGQRDAFREGFAALLAGLAEQQARAAAENREALRDTVRELNTAMRTGAAPTRQEVD
jgi:hypothetical protein